jgi:chromosomal replication initiator protein
MILTKTREQLWEHVLTQLKPELKDETFDLWLKPLRAVQGDGSDFVLQVPNRFFSDWIKAHYQARIELLLSELSNSEIKLSFETQGDESFSKPPQESVPSTDVKLTSGSASKTSSFADELRLDSKYNFGNFVVGPSNRFAEAAAEAVAKDPGRTYNPLFIYGGVGLGKTHLLHSIARHISQTNPAHRVMYVPSERFINEFIDAIRFEKMKDFRAKYRSVDCLLIDDIQFLMGKDSSQEEFFYTFNTLYDLKKQIVICSDRPPKETMVGDRLVSRFEWGVIADVQAPDLETRIAILRKKTSESGLQAPDDVILFVATHIKTNIRELEGAITRIMA